MKNQASKKGEHLASLSLLNQDGYGENLLLYSGGQKKRLRNYATNLSAVNKNGIICNRRRGVFLCLKLHKRRLD